MYLAPDNSAALFNEALGLALNKLALFASSPSFIEQMTVAFGSGWSPIIAQELVAELAEGKLPTIEAADLGGALGAYAADTNKIYLAQKFLLANQANPQAIADVLLEEIGHSIDARLNKVDSSGDEGEIFAALVNQRAIGTTELANLKSEGDQKILVINGQATAVEQATYGSINVDGNLADWIAAERIDTAPGSGVAGYEVYSKYAANNYVFGIKSAVAIGNGSTIWIDADQNAATGFQVFGFTGGAEYNIQIGADGKANLYSGNEGQTFVSALDYSLSADSTQLEVAVAETALGAASARINVLADINNSVYLPGDYSRFRYTVAQNAASPRTTYGNITLDGAVTDWTAADRLDILPGSGQAGYEVYGKNTLDGYAFAIQSVVTIGTNTTIWLDTDKDKSTGFQIFGSFGGAERNINIAADGNAYLYSGSAGQTFITKLDSKISIDGKTLEVAIGKEQIAAGNGLNVLADINDSVFLPGDYNTAPYNVSSSTTDVLNAFGNITVDGSLADWQQIDRLDYQPGVAQAGYQVFGKNTTEGYVFAINSAIAVGANSTIWLDTDQNSSTGFQIFGTTPTSAGAEYNINIAADGNAYLYTGGAGQNIVAKVETKLSADGKQWEVGIRKDLLSVSGTGINVLADVNNTTFLPGDYSRSPLTVSSTALPTRTDLSKKVGIVYSETSANKFFDKKAYNQLFGNAQNQATQAGINFDILTEADLKDLSKVVQYDSLVFAGFANVKSADVATIENVLTQASAKYGVGLIAAGDFLTNDETGAALAGDPYQRLKNLFDVNRTSSGTVTGGAVSVNIKDVSSILESSYTAGEQIASYANNLTFAAYTGLTQTGTVLADQTVNGQKYNAVIATQTGGRNVHFADQSIFADSNLGWQGLGWSVYGNQAKVGLELTRSKSILISRDDVDQSRFSLEAPAIEAQVGNILAEWKTKYNFVGSHYINIGNNPSENESTDWSVLRPIYQKWLALGNEIGTHSYTHPENVSLLNATQLEFEFNQSKQIISQQLGITVTGAATPGNPESLFVDQELSKYFQYVSGVGSAYTNSFGYLEPGDDTIFLAPNISFDFNLIDFRKLTAAQAEVVWANEYAQITKHGNTPFVLFDWHDYGVTESLPGYTRAIYENFIARAYSDGTEFATLDDAQKRIRAFDSAKLTVNQVGDIITASIADATDIGKFALDIDAGTKVIKNVTNYYAYDNDSVFTTKTGGSYTINLGTTVDDISHITSLDQRNELISVNGDGTNLNFSFNGEGKITTDMQAIAANQRYRVTGADDFKVTGDKLELTFNSNTSHTVSILVVNDTAPIVVTPITNLITTANAPGAGSIDLSKVFSDIDKDTITASVVSNSNTNLLKAVVTGTTLNLNYVPYEFGTTTITLRGTAGGKSVDTSFNVTLNGVTPVRNGTNNAETINGNNSNNIIKGLNGNDRLNGGGGNDVLIGGGGNDSLFGGAGSDVLLGTNPLSVTPGQGSYDVLQGDGGNDQYVLGDVNAVYYNDGVGDNVGRSDYGAIIGFAAGDTIQLKGKAADYTLSLGTALNNGNQQGTLIQSTLFGQPELIGFVAGSNNLSLTSTAFAYV